MPAALTTLLLALLGLAASPGGGAPAARAHGAHRAQPTGQSHRVQPTRQSHRVQPTGQSHQSINAAGHAHRRAAAKLPPELPPKPPIKWDPIPFGPRRKAETTAYVRRHYGSFIKHPSWRLVHPRVIVIHYTVGSYTSTFNTFANDVPDAELHELPATSAHFVTDTQGAIHQLVSLHAIARHTVGLNWTAIGIEHVGYSDAQVLGDRRQMAASLALVRWLRCRYHIPVRDVIGHNESLSSPYHHEDVPALRTQTHDDFDHHDMRTYRARLRRLGGCPGTDRS